MEDRVSPQGLSSAPLITNADATDLTVRPFRDGEDAAVLDLLRRAFPRWPRTNVAAPSLEHLRWKLRLAETDERMHKVALRDGRVAGLVMSFGRSARLGDLTVRCWQNADACADPAFHARGTMTAIRDSGRDDDLRPFALAFSIQSRHPAIRKMRNPESRHRGVFGNRLERFVRPLKLRDAVETFRIKPGRSGRKLVRSAAGLARWLLGRAGGLFARDTSQWTVCSAASFDSRMDAFWAQASPQFKFIMVRDSAYLSWRYLDPRAPLATVRVAEQDGRILGFVAFGVDREGAAAHIADLLVLPGRTDVVESLLHDAIAHGRSAGARRIEMWLPEHHPYRATLEARGFVMRRRKQLAGYRVMDGATAGELAMLADPNAPIHLTLGDTDRV
jgi:hypothetical protein